MRTAGRTGAWTALVGLAVAVSACGNGTSITTPFVTTPAVLQHGPEYEVKTGPVAGLGTVLIDGEGITVYMFNNDVRGQPSRCYNISAVQWPPLVLPPGVAAPVAGPGIRPTLLGTAPGPDGTTQITYNGWPLYLWPPDRDPGMATGQALTNAGGLWYVLTPEGRPVRTAAA